MYQVAPLVPTTLTLPVAPNLFCVAQAFAVPRLSEPQPISRNTLIPNASSSAQVPLVSPAIVIVFLSQVFALLIV